MKKYENLHSSVEFHIIPESLESEKAHQIVIYNGADKIYDSSDEMHGRLNVLMGDVVNLLKDEVETEMRVKYEFDEYAGFYIRELSVFLSNSDVDTENLTYDFNSKYGRMIEKQNEFGVTGKFHEIKVTGSEFIQSGLPVNPIVTFSEKVNAINVIKNANINANMQMTHEEDAKYEENFRYNMSVNKEGEKPIIYANGLVRPGKNGIFDFQNEEVKIEKSILKGEDVNKEIVKGLHGIIGRRLTEMKLLAEKEFEEEVSKFKIRVISEDPEMIKPNTDLILKNAVILSRINDRERMN